MSPLFAILLILPAIYAKIEIDIVATENETERQILMRGNTVDIISDLERDTFKLTDEELKKSVQAYFGARPDDAFLRSPTPWGDLYKTFSWSEVSRTLTPSASKVLSVASEPALISTQVLKNPESTTRDYYAHIHQKVENTVSSVWMKEGGLNVGQEIKYDFDIKGERVYRNRLAYTAKWGENVTKSETVKVGSENAVKITLEPKQTVVLELHASKVSMKIKLDFVATLAGSTAVNYSKQYKGHQFWALDVNAVMKAGGLKMNVMSSEIIDLGYYSDAKVVVRDVSTEKVLYSIPMEFF